MIPYFHQPEIHLFGPASLHAFGLLVGIGIIVGTTVLGRYATRMGLDATVASRLATWILIGGFLGAHLVDRFVYFPAETFAHPETIPMVWKGISSFGGFLGAVATAIWFLRREKPAAGSWPYLDALAYALPFGWLFGRIGCFVAFDHPGAPTTFFLGESDEHGIVRHNLGLEEAIYTAVLVAAIVVLGRKKRPPRFMTGMLAALYAPVRFGLDFLRIVDVRYFGLTPGQWGSLALLGLGIALVVKSMRERTSPPAAASTAA